MDRASANRPAARVAEQLHDDGRGATLILRLTEERVQLAALPRVGVCDDVLTLCSPPVVAAFIPTGATIAGEARSLLS